MSIKDLLFINSGAFSFFLDHEEVSFYGVLDFLHGFFKCITLAMVAGQCRAMGVILSMGKGVRKLVPVMSGLLFIVESIIKILKRIHRLYSGKFFKVGKIFRIDFVDIIFKHGGGKKSLGVFSQSAS